MDINNFSPQFQISGKVNTNNLNFVMKVNSNDKISTSTIPATSLQLALHLPSIFGCNCFNDGNKSFGEECKNTELGHLFEHIMLEYLCIEKMKNGSGEASYEGVTQWEVDPKRKGTFYIEIKIGESESEIIQKAFNKSIELLGKIVC